MIRLSQSAFNNFFIFLNIHIFILFIRTDSYYKNKCPKVKIMLKTWQTWLPNKFNQFQLFEIMLEEL